MNDNYTTELAAWSAIVGTLLPLAIALISQYGWSARTRSLLTVVLSVVASAGTVYFTNPGGLETAPLVITVATVMTLAGSTYRTFWKPTGIAPTVERTTSI